MAITEPSCVVFVNKAGQPLPDWLQAPLLRQVYRLNRDFPVFGGDLAAIQNTLDEVGQRVAERVNDGMVIENLNAYVDSAASNAAIDETRRRPTVPVADERVLSNLRANVAVEDPLWSNAFQDLSKEEEDIVVRYFWYGDRHTEIARELGLSDTAVRTRFSRALLKVRKRLGVAKAC